VLYTIHHVGVAVHSADAALAFYRDVCGLRVTKDATLPEQGVRGILLAAGGTEIELLEPLDTDSPVGRFLARRGEGLHHLCFATDDVETELLQARQRGLRLIDEHPRPGLAGMIAFIHPQSVQGILVEYAQPPAPAHAAAAARPPMDAAAPAFDHLAIAVADPDAAANGFIDAFRLVEGEKREYPSLGIYAARIEAGPTWIGFVGPLSRGSAVAKYLSERGPGLYAISLSVSRLDSFIEALRAQGVRCADVAAIENGDRVTFVSPRSAHGVLIQLVDHGG
jgi:methylmalonyl-CoA/ethylmalonyl-CoA epimerase